MIDSYDIFNFLIIYNLWLLVADGYEITTDCFCCHRFVIFITVENAFDGFGDDFVVFVEIERENEIIVVACTY